MSTRACHRRWVCTLLAGLVSLAPAAHGQSASVPALKAAFLYNFVKFTEWPAEALPPNVPLMLCVSGDPAVADALMQAAKGQQIDGHSIVVARLKPDADVRSCNLLYAGEIESKRALEILAAVKGAAVFAVSDWPSFAQLGGTAQLFIEDGRMRFAVNLDAAHRSRLRLSSQLLSLARLVKDDPHVLPR